MDCVSGTVLSVFVWREFHRDLSHIFRVRLLLTMHPSLFGSHKREAERLSHQLISSFDHELIVVILTPTHKLITITAHLRCTVTTYVWLAAMYGRQLWAFSTVLYVC